MNFLILLTIALYFSMYRHINENAMYVCLYIYNIYYNYNMI